MQNQIESFKLVSLIRHKKKFFDIHLNFTSAMLSEAACRKSNGIEILNHSCKN